MKPVVQCKTCPWRVTTTPDTDIPNYDRELAEGLSKTIRSGIETLFDPVRRIMACHYSKPGAEFPCAGWLHNQIGPGNNFAIRIDVMTERLPPPEVDGPQHERYQDTLCPTQRRRRT